MPRQTTICRSSAAPRAASNKQDDLQMLKTLVVGAAGALALMTSNAVADGMPTRAAKASVCCEQPNWTGFYIGVGVGGAFTENEHRAKEIDKYWDDTTSVTKLWDLENGRSHAFGTVTAGYDHLFDSRWLAGVFVDYDFGNGNNHSSILGIGPYYDIRLSDESKHAWSIGGRLGFLSTPSTLLYLSTGWTQVSADGKVSFWSLYDYSLHRQSFNNDRDGWFVGGGIETQLGRGLSLRGEYRFTRLDDDHKSINLYNCDYCEVVSSRLALDRDTDVHSLRVVLSYKFGRREEVAPLK
jgi:outer membrane immunogenic protein